MGGGGLPITCHVREVVDAELKRASWCTCERWSRPQASSQGKTPRYGRTGTRGCFILKRAMLAPLLLVSGSGNAIATSLIGYGLTPSERHSE